MDELNRRALLGAAGLVGVSAITKSAHAGPLNPPAGNVASSGRTLDEVYNKIPALGASDGRIPIPGSAIGISITQPGNYVLTGNITSSNFGIQVTASDVTIDLNGFSVTTTDISGAAIINQASISNFTVRNGVLVGGNPTVNINGQVSNVLLQDLTIRRSRFIAVSISGTLVRGVHLQRCRFVDIGGGTLAVDPNASITALGIDAPNVTVEECLFSRFLSNGGGAPSFRALRVGLNTTSLGIVISRCVVSNDTSLTGPAIVFSAGSTGVYRDNTVVNFTSPYSGGTNGGGNV